MDISVVLPTYNEKENIMILIPELESIFKKNNLKGEIIVVDDSSPDGTADAAYLLNKRYGNVKVVLRPKKEGIGAALRDGYNHASGNVIFSMDSDLSFDHNLIPVFLEKLKQYDLVVGSRHTAQGGYEKKNLNIFMKWLTSRGGNFVLRLMSGVNVHDFSANFRGIKKSVWDAIKTTDNTNSILFEMILLTKYKGFKVSEIPVTFKDRVHGESKLNLAKEAPSFFLKATKWSLKSRLGRL
ncbi:MAG: polyprenol monophosphomannose synthase [Candidatus Nanoarchaeia archaeon]